MMKSKGFFGSLFDLSFSSFITTELVKFIYILILLIGAVAVIVAGSIGGIFGFLRALLAFAISILIARVYLELTVVIFRMSKNLDHITDHLKDEKAELPPLAPQGQPPVEQE